MAQLWRSDPVVSGWTAEVLDARGVALVSRDARAAVLCRAATDLGEEWLLLCAAGGGVTVNGDPPVAGAVVLRDRDQIRIAGQAAAFFSTRHAAATQAATEADATLRCARCRRRLAAGATVVRCPGCGVVHHENGALRCWTYAATCALCSEPTALDDASPWSPEEL